MPCQQFVTIPLGPVVQVLYGSLETANRMHYCKWATANILEYTQMCGRKLKEYNDTTCGRDYLEAVKIGIIKYQDMIM